MLRSHSIQRLSSELIIKLTGEGPNNNEIIKRVLQERVQTTMRL